jgi:hypothetical protein
VIRTLAVIILLALSACAPQQQYSITKAGSSDADKQQQDMGACKLALAQTPLAYQTNHGLVSTLMQDAQSRQNEYLADCMRSKGWTVTAQQQ